jgi:ABC-2 type transport system permease protein
MNIFKTLFKKESSNYLNSSVALIFLGTFLLLTLFTFFVADKFFERNLADLRPLFRWMPILLIFLVSALTMRSWSEERSQGTLELLLTWPVKIPQLVIGKFFGVMALIALALALTFPLVLTVNYLGELDWGPVIGGYLGCLLVAGAYAAIGLWISSLTANQIAALFLTGITCGFFYILGSDLLVGLVPNHIAEILLALGTGSRFESIGRGVLDLRDILYYLSITFFFGLLNIFSLVKGRWSVDPSQKFQKSHHRQWLYASVLVFLNLLALNFWMFQVHFLRLDLTKNREYSISKTTKNYIQNLREPLTIKFYFTETHPYLKPLIPQIRDLIKEYQIVSNGKVHGEFIDPTQNEEAEIEANQNYGIRPFPIQVPGRNETKIVNSYFNILIRYGDQHVVLDFQDLIEIHTSGLNQFEIKLRNLEYDLTRSIKKVVFGFQGVEELFATIGQPIEAKIIYSSQTLPEKLVDVPRDMQAVYQDIANRSAGKFILEMIDLDAPDASMTLEQVENQWDIKPVRMLTGPSFFLHTLIKSGEENEVLYPTSEIAEKAIRDNIVGVIEKKAQGFLKTVGLWTPPAQIPDLPPQFMRGRAPPGDTFRFIHEILESDYKVHLVDLKSGSVPKDIDVLLVVKPRDMSEPERFALDQFLMQGGTVIVAGGFYEMVPSPPTHEGGGQLIMKPLERGIHDLLAYYGIEIEKNLVMDLQSNKFPIPSERTLAGGIKVPTIQLIDYPFFVDVRSDGYAKDHLALSGLPQVTLNWPSSLKLDEEKVQNGKLQALMQSSDQSWVQTSTEIQPNFERYGDTSGFRIPQEMQKSTLAATLEGPFESFYKDKPSPLLEAGSEAEATSSNLDTVLQKSTSSSRVIVIGSGDFIGDTILNLSRGSGKEDFKNSLQFVQNLIDWSLEDVGLLSIRSRGTFARTLKKIEDNKKALLEYGNYFLVFLTLMGLAIFLKFRRKNVRPINLSCAKGVEERIESTRAGEKAA